MPEWVKANNVIGIAYYTVAKQLLLYLYGAFEEALEITDKGKKCMDSMIGTMLTVEHYFYESLALVAHYPQLGKYEQKNGLKRVRDNQKKMREWAAHAPMNFSNKYVLIEAEMARMGEGAVGATKLYDKSIALAKKNNYLLEEAIANELAAKFCLFKGMKDEARGYMQEAHHGFDRWGAKIKVKDLEKEYPDLLQQPVEETTTAPFGQLDYAAIVSSLQAISTEIILEDLLKKLMTIVIENAGAERGFFLSVRNKELYVEAEASLGQDDVLVSKLTPIQARDDLAISVPNYVRQTMNVIVLDDAAKDGDFAADRYVLDHQPKSILCLPVVRQSKLVGILYLENNVATGAFTPDRIEVLKLLASQAAISIENARLYDDVVRNESELRVSEEKYRTILESIEDGYYEVDRSGNFTLVNDSLCKILGYSKTELIGMNYKELMDEDDAQQIYETFKRVLNTQEAVKGFDNEFIRRDGIRINNELSVSLVQTSEGQNIGFRGILRDVTKRKKISEELRMHRDHLEELVKDRTTELTKANEKLKQEIEARVLAEEKLMSYRDHLEDLVTKRTAQVTAANEQLRQEIKDRMSAEQEAKLRQEQLFQAAKMASLGTLVSGVAHEINNPISSVMLNAPILQKAWRGVKPVLDEHCLVNGEFRIANMSYEELGNRIPLLLSGIVEGAQRVKTIVNDLKEFSRLSPPELIDMVDINDATKAAIGLVFNLIKKSTKHFSVDYESNMPSIKGNTQRIEQVLINLLVNACQSLANNQKSISVSTTHDSKLECAVVEICDQGKGMSPEELERIKDPFFTTKRDTGGTGLGLAISDRIVSDHGGKLVFDSTVGAGTTVKVLLPVSSQKQEEAERQNERNT
ncbi:MAG: PAS domain S-box protein [Deltaproteobacteria bacterium]|nr:PAS domain S-box protein [Deltaproteobacteria bacterium]